MIDQFLDRLAATGKSQQTIRTYRIQLVKFQKWLQSHEYADDLSAVAVNDVSDYRNALQESDKKPATVNTALAAIDAYCSWMVIEGRMGSNPVDLVGRVAQVAEPPKWLTRSEYSRVLRAVEKRSLRDIAIIHVLLMAGLRASELCGLTHGDVVISDRMGSVTVRRGKGNKRRIVPIGKAARYWLAKYIAEDHPIGKWLFASQRGEQLTYQGLYKLCATIAEEAHVDGMTPHALRHTYGHNLALKNIPIQTIAVLMGHERLENTMIYVRPGADELQEVAEKLSYM